VIPGIGLQEIVIIAVVAVILFGSRLPEVAKTAGKHYFEFKKGLFDVQKNFDPRNFFDDTPSGKSTKSKPSKFQDDYDDYDEATAPRFEPPPAEKNDV
jgi:sec-independent protein translocase protein TatA